MRLLTCSNSGPAINPADSTLIRSHDSPGGLVPIVTELLREHGGSWIFTAPTDGPTLTDRAEDTRRDSSPFYALPISRHTIEQQREQICIKTLLWLFHYLLDTAVEPVFDRDFHNAWGAYRSVNETFADSLAGRTDNADDEVVLVHDFHLMLVPGMFQDKVGRRRSTLAYFHHVPWCEPDYFSILPGSTRLAILESLLACDVEAFHSDRWAKAFLACCGRFLPDVHIQDANVIYRDHRTAVTAAPAPLDAEALRSLLDETETDRWRQIITGRADGRRLLVRVDRLDLWKNAFRGFLAYENILRERPRIADDWLFSAIVSLPRLQTDRHRHYQRLCEEVVTRINDTYGAGHGVVDLIYPDGPTGHRNRAAAALASASVTLVNPTYDGLNVVAKESLILNPDAQLLLSVNAGVYPQIKDAVEPIEPFDLTTTADVLNQALHRETPPRKDAVAQSVRLLEADDSIGWLKKILST